MTDTLHHGRGTSPPVAHPPDGHDLPDDGDPVGPHRRTAQADGRRRRRLVVATVAAAVTLVAGLALAVPTPEPTESVEAGLGLPGDGGGGGAGGATFGLGPTVLRSKPVTALTPTHLLVWAGEDGTGEIDRADGFTVDLGSGAVEPIPHAPVTRLRETDGAWTGRELVVVTSGACDSCSTPEPVAAAWDPEDGWRGVADPPSSLGEGTVGAVWTGAHVVLVTRSGSASAYDPVADVWVDLPPVGVEASGRPSLVWTGRDVVYWAAGVEAERAGAAARGAVVDRGWTWAPGATAWAPLPYLPDRHRTWQGSAVWTGAELVVWGAKAGADVEQEVVGVGATLRAGAESWTPLPRSPQPPAAGYEGTPGSQTLAVDPATGRVVVLPLDPFGAARRDLLLLDAATGSWTTTDVALRVADATFAVAGGMLLVPHPRNPVAARLP